LVDAVLGFQAAGIAGLQGWDKRLGRVENAVIGNDA